ncbi:hypothetical protein Vi05172_g11724 [Venturia inaequalis]|nr:hypothetical protein Vi05172_g11724 [Venturia inaequalis]
MGLLEDTARCQTATDRPIQSFYISQIQGSENGNKHGGAFSTRNLVLNIGGCDVP